MTVTSPVDPANNSADVRLVDPVLGRQRLLRNTTPGIPHPNFGYLFAGELLPFVARQIRTNTLPFAKSLGTFIYPTRISCKHTLWRFRTKNSVQSLDECLDVVQRLIRKIGVTPVFLDLILNTQQDTARTIHINRSYDDLNVGAVRAHPPLCSTYTMPNFESASHPLSTW